MARPKKEDAKKASAQVGLRMRQELRDALVLVAERNGRTLTEEVIAALERHVGLGAAQRERLPKRLPADPKPVRVGT